MFIQNAAPGIAVTGDCGDSALNSQQLVHCHRNCEAVTIFSHIDCMVIESVWVLEQADLKRKKQIAKERAHENIKFIRGIVEEHMLRARRVIRAYPAA
jgi:hypothetical protein